MKRLNLPLLIIATAVGVTLSCLLITKCSNNRPPGKPAVVLPAAQLPITKQNVVPKIIYRDTGGRTHIVYENKPELPTRDLAAYVRDSVAPVLDIANSTIDHYIQVTAQLSGELRATKVELDRERTEKRYYKSKYMTITVSSREGLPADSSTANYTYDAQLNFVGYSAKKNLLSRRRFYEGIYSLDTNYRIYGVQRFNRELPVPRTIFKLAGYGDMELNPNAGWQANGANFGLEAEVNTDGLFSPYVRGGYRVAKDFDPALYLQVGGKVNLLRIRARF